MIKVKDLDKKVFENKVEKNSKCKENGSILFKTSNTDEIMKPSVSFADEIIKIFDVKNYPLDNNSFQNKFRDKCEFDQKPYFNCKNYSLDDSLNEVLVENDKNFNQKCEMQIYKTEKPFFLRPCMSLRLLNRSEYVYPKGRIDNRERKKSAIESKVAKYIYGEKSKSIIKNSSIENLSDSKPLTKSEKNMETINIKSIETLKSEKNLNSANKNENHELFYRNLYDILHINKNTNTNRIRTSKIPIRQGSSLERRPEILIERNKPTKKIKFDLNGKNYEEIFEKMRKNDRENRLDYLLNSMAREKNDSKVKFLKQYFKK